MHALLAESYLHRLSPFIVRFTDDFGIRWYGLSYLFGFLAAWLVFRAAARSGRSPLTENDAGDLVFSIVLGVLLGGRLGYILFYQPALLVGFTATPPFWDLLAINKGGMASHGGIIGFIVAVCLFARRRRLPALHLLDLGAVASTIGLGAGRVANFVNAELWGKALPDQANPPWWSVKYPEEILHADWPNAAALRAALGDRIGGAETFGAAVVEAVRAGNAEVIEIVRPLLTAWYPSQLIQALTDGPILLAILIVAWLRPRKPGVVGGTWLLGYALLRIATETVRQPDAGVDLILGLSRGQQLSMLMALAGITVLAIVARRPVEKLALPLVPASRRGVA